MLDMLNKDDGVALWTNDSNSKMVSTIHVDDGRKPFETAVQHPDYNNGKMVIVACYDTKNEALTGHAQWLNLMQSGKLPDKLIDCVNSDVSQIINVADGQLEKEFEKLLKTIHAMRLPTESALQQARKIGWDRGYEAGKRKGNDDE